MSVMHVLLGHAQRKLCKAARVRWHLHEPALWCSIWERSCLIAVAFSIDVCRHLHLRAGVRCQMLAWLRTCRKNGTFATPNKSCSGSKDPPLCAGPSQSKQGTAEGPLERG